MVLLVQRAFFLAVPESQKIQYKGSRYTNNSLGAGRKFLNPELLFERTLLQFFISYSKIKVCILTQELICKERKSLLRL